MQQLHLVGFTTDLEGLIFSARKGAKSGGYLVVLDDKLQAAIEDALRLRDGHAPGDVVDAEGAVLPRPRRPRPQSTLSPREIQARLRMGSTIDEVAEEAGVDEEWVSRFAAPILAEQAQVVGRARRLTFVKARLGESAQPLGVAVRWNLADKSIRMLDDDYDVAWSAYNLQGASWVIRFQYVSRQKRHVAEWEVDLRENQLFARNRLASELGYVDPARRRRRPPVLEPSPRETPARPVDAAGGSASGSATIAGAGERSSDGGAGGPTVPIVDVRVPRSAKAKAPAVAPASARPARGVKPAAKGGAAASGGRGAATATRGATARGGTGRSAAGRSGAGKAGAGKAGASKTGAGKAGVGKAAGKKAAAGGKAAAARGTAGKAKSGAGRATATKGAGKRGRAGGRASDASGPDPAAAAPRVEEPVRRSHLARPPSPMPMARRANTPPFPGARPVPPPARPAPPSPASRPPAVSRSDAGDAWDDGIPGATKPRAEAAAGRPRPDDAPVRLDGGAGGRRPVAVTEGVRVFDGGAGDNGGATRLPRPTPTASPAPAPTQAGRRSAAAPDQAARRPAAASDPAARAQAAPRAPGPGPAASRAPGGGRAEAASAAESPARTSASEPASRRPRLPSDAPPPSGEPIDVDGPSAAGRPAASGRPSPEQRLARRLAAGANRGRGVTPDQASPARADAGSAPTAPGAAPGAGPTAARGPGAPPSTQSTPSTRRARTTPAPADDSLWHGPGSGEPAPPVRIRADLAAGTIRPTETPEPPPSPDQARAARERPLRARPDGRRERPLRAR